MENDKIEFINRDYLGVIKQIDNNFVYDTINIKQEYNLIQSIKEMVNDKKYSILDMQDALEMFYPQAEYKYESYSYLFPLDYGSAYIKGARIPEYLTVEKYEEKLLKEKEYLTKKYLDNEETQNTLFLLKSSDLESYSNTLSKIHKNIEDGIEEYKYNLKKWFNFERFIYAANYYKTLESINDESIKMVSTDQIGWKEPTFPFFPDLTISVRSNFAYGSSSYFHCNIKYKGVSILPYTDIVEYYYVNMSDFIRCTRSYKPIRENWKEVFEFVLEIANNAYNSQQDFIDKWVVKELELMLNGLRQLNINPKKHFTSYITKKSEPNFKYNTVRNIESDDELEYEVLPNEKSLALKVEKITGSLFLLDGLRELSILDERINDSIKEIEEMNIKLHPLVIESIDNINEDIDSLYNQIEELEKQIETINKEIEPDVKEINRILYEMNQTGRFYHTTYSFSSAESKYIQINKDRLGFSYIKNKKRILEIENKIKELKNHVKMRKNFIRELEKCNKRIKRYLKCA